MTLIMAHFFLKKYALSCRYIINKACENKKPKIASTQLLYNFQSSFGSLTFQITAI